MPAKKLSSHASTRDVSNAFDVPSDSGQSSFLSFHNVAHGSPPSSNKTRDHIQLLSVPPLYRCCLAVVRAPSCEEHIR